MFCSLFQPVVKLLINRHNNKYSYTGWVTYYLNRLSNKNKNNYNLLLNVCGGFCNTFSALNVYGVNDIQQTEVYTAESLMCERPWVWWNWTYCWETALSVGFDWDKTDWNIPKCSKSFCFSIKKPSAVNLFSVSESTYYYMFSYQFDQ